MELTPNEPTYTDLNDLFVNVTFLNVTGVNSNKTFCGDYRTGPLSKLFLVNEELNIMNEQNYGINPGFATYRGGINDSSWVCGYYIDGVNYRAFVWKIINNYDTIRYPGENRAKFTGINNRGLIVGAAGYAGNIGFIVDYVDGNYGTFKDIEIDGATSITPMHVSENNCIVGYYTDATIMVNGLSPGIYIVKIQTEDKDYTARFIKQ
jgi:hypothetical protein